MKLIVVIVVSIVVLTVSSREPPDGRTFYNDDHSFTDDLDIPEEHDLSNGRELTNELGNSYDPDLPYGHVNNISTIMSQSLSSERRLRVLNDEDDMELKDVKVDGIQKEENLRGGSKCKTKKLEAKVDDLETKLLSIAVNLTIANSNLNTKLESIMNYIISANDSITENQGTIEAKFDNISLNLKSELMSLKENMNTSELNMNKELQSLKSSMNTGNSKLNTELQSLKSNINTGNSKLNTELQSLKNNMNTGNSNLNTRLQSIKTSQDNGFSTVNTKQDNQGCSKGTFLYSPTNQCFRLLTDTRRNYDASKAACRSLGLQMGQTYDPITLRHYLISKYGEVYHTWIGARGSGSYMTWERTRVNIQKDNRNSYWANGRPSNQLSSAYCLLLLTADGWWKAQPNQPYYNIACSNGYWTLCELVRG